MARDVADLREAAPTSPDRSSDGPSVTPGREGRGDKIRRWRARLTERPIADDGRHHSLQPSAARTLHDVGMFRTVTVAALADGRYAGDRAGLRRDLRSLTRLGLVEQHRVTVRSGRPRARGGRRAWRTLGVVLLTKTGRAEALRRSRGGGAQDLYAGFVKPRELVHDAAVYRMYQAETARLAQAGARVRRVILDYELKRRVFSGTKGARAGSPEHAAVAAAHGLHVIDGQIAFPDLRLEYETAGGDLARVDLELTTEHYKDSQLAAKADAGFRFYVAGPPSARMTAVFEGREITASILEL